MFVKKFILCNKKKKNEIEIDFTNIFNTEQFSIWYEQN